MAEENRTSKPHILTLPYPSQGHINPLLHLSKRLASKGAKTTLATTVFIAKSFTVCPATTSQVQFDTISDGFDDGGFSHAESIESYISHLQAAGSKSLAELIQRHKRSGHPIDCIVYDAFLPWAIDVAKAFGLRCAAFFTQPCAVNYIYYLVYNGVLVVPGDSASLMKIPGMPEMVMSDMPSFIAVSGSYSAYFELVLNQFCNVEKADAILGNSFHQLEPQVIDIMSGIYPTLTIGPTIPSKYLDKQVSGDDDYGLNLFSASDPNICADWLSTKPKGSVVYVSFGSMAVLGEEQMYEIAFALKSLDCYFLWVVRECEQPKIPSNFANDTSTKGLLVSWCPQLEVLASEALGCFFTHCGWNSTVEALSLGVVMVGMPQWTDQPTNAKLVEDFWQVGKRVKVDENGVVGREEIESCIKEVMESKDLKKNALKWRELAKEAVCEGGSSDRNIDQFISKILCKT
ncbi:unnamed protein product [Rhodiola kirilowii]